MRAAIATLTLACGAALAGGAAGQEAGWPAPAEGWWEDLRPGTRAVFAREVGDLRQTWVVEVEEVEGSLVTFSSQLFLGAEGERPLGERTETIDAAAPGPHSGALPAGARAERTGAEDVEAAGRTFACAVFVVRAGGVEKTVWRAADLPPLFAGGCVRQEVAAGEDRPATSVALVAYEVPPPEEGR